MTLTTSLCTLDFSATHHALGIPWLQELSLRQYWMQKSFRLRVRVGISLLGWW